MQSRHAARQIPPVGYPRTDIAVTGQTDTETVIRIMGLDVWDDGRVFVYFVTYT